MPTRDRSGSAAPRDRPSYNLIDSRARGRESLGFLAFIYYARAGEKWRLYTNYSCRTRSPGNFDE